jgi:hypothetical protein
MVVHTCNPSTEEVEAGGSSVLDQPELHSETLSPKILGLGGSSVVEHGRVFALV